MTLKKTLLADLSRQYAANGQPGRMPGIVGVILGTLSPRFAPVVIRAGICGNERDLVLSPQHRMLFSGTRAELFFGESEVLVAACHLVAAGLASQRLGGTITYYHLVFDRHEIIFSDKD